MGVVINAEIYFRTLTLEVDKNKRLKRLVCSLMAPSPKAGSHVPRRKGLYQSDGSPIPTK